MAETESGRSRRVEFELLRILAMAGVVMNHVFNYGLDIYGDFRVDASSPVGALVWSVLEILKLMALPSVNCYILITGYFMIDRTELRLKGIWKVWSTTWFYAIGIYLLCVLLSIVPFEGKELLRHATPLLSNDYWFVTSYLILLLLAPFISWALQHASKRQYQMALVIGGIICFQPLLGWLLMGKQQVLLFIYLFMIGGYIRKYADQALSMRQAVLAYIATMMVMFAYTLYKNHPLENTQYAIFAMAYHGLVLPLSVAMFYIAKAWRIENERIGKAILFLAPLSFAVYIIHTQSIVHNWLWAESAELLSRSNVCVLPLLCIAITLAVFVVCVLVDYLRVSLSRFIKKTVSRIL